MLTNCVAQKGVKKAMEQKDRILEIVKMLPPKIEGGENDDILNIYIDMVTQTVLNYCNRNDIPDALIFVIARMVRDEYNKAFNVGEFELNSDDVSSVSEDGRTVSFNTKKQDAALNSIHENKITNRQELNKYRLLYRQ